MPPAAAGLAARHHAAARGRGRDAAPASFPSAAATAAQRCAAFVAAVVRASEDPELALGALHVARREVRKSKTPQTLPACHHGSPALACDPFRRAAGGGEQPRERRRRGARRRGAAGQARRRAARLAAPRGSPRCALRPFG
jgi:hypothetical protein